MSETTALIDRTFYRFEDSNWDDLKFRARMLKAIQPHHIVLDLGAGAGIVKHLNFSGHCRIVCGVDMDERVLENPYLGEGRLGTGESIPYPDDTFDIVFSANVLEHLEDPIMVFSEIERVLKPGGKFLFKTPNRFHYAMLIAQLTPTSFHKFINRKRGRKEVDTFPTLYRANSAWTIKRLAEKTGFTVTRLDFIEGRPEYLRFSALPYLMGCAYERLVNSSDLFSRLRIVMIGELIKTTWRRKEHLQVRREFEDMQ